VCGGHYAYWVIVDLSARELRLSISLRGILRDKERRRQRCFESVVEANHVSIPMLSEEVPERGVY
jgi:hypothetical protein